eukprot:jgi/Chrzof1/10168/Cz04g31140.t1
MTDAVARDLENQYNGFQACFGGEELKRACATLSGALVGKKSKSPLQALAEDADLHVRELAFAARQYATAIAEDPHDYDALYNHGLVLQELSNKLPGASKEQVQFLRQACDRYEAALALKPNSHAALYNLGVALSDLARALKTTNSTEATACLHLASQKYAASLQCNPNNPQALNNWGLVLQELSADCPDWSERDQLVRHAMNKFRLALRSRPDFDRGCYNLGTVFYTFACALQSEPGQPKDARSRQAREFAVRNLFSVAAQYICLAHALQPTKDIYRKSLSVVRQMLPLPLLRAGYLTAPVSRTIGSVQETYRRDWFVLDHVSLRAASHMESSLSAASTGVLSSQRLGAQPSAATADDPLVVPLSDIVTVHRCDDPSLPEGEAFWISLGTSPMVRGWGYNGLCTAWELNHGCVVFRARDL